MFVFCEVLFLVPLLFTIRNPFVLIISMASKTNNPFFVDELFSAMFSFFEVS